MIDTKELEKLITSEIKKNIVIQCEKGNHKFVSVRDGTLDVRCTQCGIKAMRAVAKIK